MTAQASDHFNNQHAAANFGELSVYGVIIGDVRTNHGWGNPYPFQNEPSIPADLVPCSALWDGYLSEYTLAPDGSLKLDAFAIPFYRGQPRQLVNERLSGDFWLVMKPDFKAKRVYVPFRDGLIVPDESSWLTEDDAPLESLKHPVRPKEFKSARFPLDEPLFVGIVAKVTVRDEDRMDPPWSWIELDREIPASNRWCAVLIRRGETLIGKSNICGSSGNAWLLEDSIRPLVQVGDQLFAIERVATIKELRAQMIAQGFRPNF